jgi:hypothetical protein
MNLERLKVIRNHIAEIEDQQFNMSDFRSSGSQCGSACCIGGWAVMLFRDVQIVNSYHDKASEILELSDKEADYMFYGVWTETPLFLITKEQAVRYLDAVLESGNVFETA